MGKPKSKPKAHMTLPTTQEERALVYRYWLEQVGKSKLPGSRPTLGAVFDKTPGGRGFGMAMLSLAAGESNEIAKKLEVVCKNWNRLDREQQDRCSIDGLVLEAGLTPGEALGAAVKYAKDFAIPAQAYLLHAFSLEAIVTMGKQAQKPGGIRDRENLLEATGALPISKGASIAIQNNLGVGVKVGDDGDDSVPALPDFEAHSIEASRISREEP